MSTDTMLPVIHGGETLRQATYSYINGVIDIEATYKIRSLANANTQTPLQHDIARLLQGQKLESAQSYTLNRAISGMKAELMGLGTESERIGIFGHAELVELQKQYHSIQLAQLCLYAARTEHGLWVVIEQGENGCTDIRGAGRLLGFEEYADLVSPIVEQADGSPGLLRRFGDVALYENLVGDELNRHLQSLHRNS